MQPDEQMDVEAVPVVPDLLQINYRMPNGNTVVHMITKAQKRTNTNQHIDTSGFRFSYTEEAFWLHKEKYKTLYKRVCLIHYPDRITIKNIVYALRYQDLTKEALIQYAECLALACGIDIHNHRLDFGSED